MYLLDCDSRNLTNWEARDYHERMSTRLCSEPGCEKAATARGLCSTHYQRQRRAKGQTPGQVGRPREYAPEVSDKHEGAPKLTVRLEPELMEWVRQQGGGAWLRHAARELRRLSVEPGFQNWWMNIRHPEPI
jgi:hypothetical protein